VRKMNELGSHSQIKPVRMMQVTPNVTVIGCLWESSLDNVKSIQPYLLILFGDLQANMNLVRIKMDLASKVSLDNLPDFRFHYVPERQLLLFSHSESRCVQALHLDENGDIIELDPLNLEESTVRGFVFYKGVSPGEEKHQMCQVEYKKKQFVLPSAPRILILDSEGDLHHFNYYDTRYLKDDQSLLVEPVKLQVLRETQLKPLVVANLSLKEDTIKQDSLFQYRGSCKSIPSPKNADNPYILDENYEIDHIFSVCRDRLYVSRFSRHDWGMTFNFKEYHVQDSRGDIRMLRISNCKYLIATLYDSSVLIHKIETFIDDLEKLGNAREPEAEFSLSEGKYSYLEWSPLTRISLDKPYFLTLDGQGILRIHNVSDKTEEVIAKGKAFRSATFSVDGRYIYAVNDKQDLCEIDCQNLSLVTKRRVEQISEMSSSHIQQLMPGVFVIGSTMKGGNPENDQLYVHIVSGDIWDPIKELRIKRIEMSFEPKKPVIFRFLYVKERQLLLLGHSGSNEVCALSFGFDGSVVEIDRFSFGDTTITMRGMVFMEQATSVQDSEIKSIAKPPQLLVLDSTGNLNSFCFADPCNSVSKYLLKTRSVASFKEFLQRKEQLKAKLRSGRKNRSKSYGHEKIFAAGQGHKRSKSQVRSSDRKILPKDKQAIINYLKSPIKRASVNLSSEKLTNAPKAKAIQRLFAMPEDPVNSAMLFLNKHESDIVFKVEDQEFPAHKSILIERCKFFKNMFSSGMSESYLAVIEISDTTALVFKAFLTYVYLSMIVLNEELALRLFEFSERYLVVEVREACEDYLRDNITVDNCSRVFEMACLYDVVSLKDTALVFFKENLETITKRKGFDDLPKTSYVCLKKMLWEQQDLML